MIQHKTGTREEWLAARVALLEDEREFTQRSDELAQRRRDLPWVRVDKPYRFDTEDGTASLADLFRGRSQLLVHHFMYGPDYTAGCPNCSSIADGYNGSVVHLVNHDVMFWAISRAPLADLRAYKHRMGWTFPWASSGGTDFNDDFGVQFSEQKKQLGPLEYNYGTTPWPPRPVGEEGPQLDALAAMTGTDWATYTLDRPGMSAFALENGIVYHTYSAYSRGIDGLWPMYQWLDRTPGGRSESEPWVNRHDEYKR